ncbi:DUF3443 family protein [Citrifermentans bremense]|uniref:DUF3443 family protein n=1 Tax=Citrifermentans bremense TaxID=60035 RepID=UPI00041C4F08|nr:DUF3443 family protein [Citrifermentans bremense]
MRSVNLLAILTFLLSFIIMPGCGGGGGAPPPAPAPTLSSVTVTPANFSQDIGASTQFTATATFSNGSTQDVTSLATWTSSAPAVATVSDATGAKGTVTTVAAGSSLITASFGGLTGSTTVTASPAGVPANVMAVSVNGGLCSAGSYLNKPCVSVTVCTPDLSACQPVDDILLDTGSYGLRVFKEAVGTLPLPQVTSGSGSLAGCTQFVDQTSLWGPIVRASVKLGNEPAVEIPIQLIDSTFSASPSYCPGAEPNARSARFSGILGVGVLTEDCGQDCADFAEIGIYYRCTGTTCVKTTVPLADQVQNPVAHLPLDNNGLIVLLPSVPVGVGAPSVSGSVIFGIGTRSNNTPASPIVFPTDQRGDISTIFNGVKTTGFFDTGSNGLFFPNADDSVLPVCADGNSDWFCPPATRALFATNVGIGGTPTNTVGFNISNFVTLANSPNNVFNDVGGPSTFGFDWGLPFFLGRSVYFGLEQKSSTLGNGPYVAY